MAGQAREKKLRIPYFFKFLTVPMGLLRHDRCKAGRVPVANPARSTTHDSQDPAGRVRCPRRLSTIVVATARASEPAGRPDPIVTTLTIEVRYYVYWRFNAAQRRNVTPFSRLYDAVSYASDIRRAGGYAEISTRL